MKLVAYKKVENAIHIKKMPAGMECEWEMMSNDFSFIKYLFNTSEESLTTKKPQGIKCFCMGNIENKIIL